MSVGNYTVQATWTPPPFDAFNLTATTDRCEKAANFTAAVVRGLAIHEIQSDVPTTHTIRFLRSILPDSYQANTSITDSHIIAWYIDMGYWGKVGSETYIPKMLLFSINDCGDAICGKLKWAGDQDITGVGMMISYYLAVILVTIYFVMLLLARWSRVQRRAEKGGWTFRILASFTETTNTFLDSALIFAIAMLAAAAYRYASYIRNPGQSQSAYALFGSVFMSTFSVFPAVVLQSLARGLRRHHVRQLLWVCVFGLTVAVDILYRKEYRNESWFDPTKPTWSETRVASQYSDQVWLATCDPRDTRLSLERLLTGAHVILGVNAFCWLLYLLSRPIRRLMTKSHRDQIRGHTKRSKIYQFFVRHGNKLWVFNAIVSLLVSWALLGDFHTYREEVSKIAEEQNEDLQWTFGQVLALSTWAPIFIEIAIVLIYGPEHGLSSRLTKQYQVIRRATLEAEKSSAGSGGRDVEKSGEPAPLLLNEWQRQGSIPPTYSAPTPYSAPMPGVYDQFGNQVNFAGYSQPGHPSPSHSRW